MFLAIHPLTVEHQRIVHIVERDLVVERTNAGLAAARARGRVAGRPPTMTAAKLAVGRQLVAAGQSKTLVAATIGVSRPTLSGHLPRGAR